MNSVSAPTAPTAVASASSYAHITAFQHSFRTNLAYLSVTSIEPIGRMRG